MAYLKPLVARLQQRFRSRMHLTVTSSVVVAEEAAAAIVDISRQMDDERQNGHMQLQHWAIGSITEEILQRTKRSLLIIPPQQIASTRKPSLEKVGSFQD